MTRVLVLGAAGFLGSHTVPALAAAGAVAVPGPPQSRLDLACATQSELVTLLRRVRPDAVVNATGRVDGNPQDLERGNAGVTRQLLAACAVAVPGIRFVQLGSLAEYGTGQPGSAWHEDGPAEPVSAYGAAKLAATGLVREATRRGEVAGCVLRVANPVGAGQPAASLVGAVIAQLRDQPDSDVRSGPLDGRRDIVSARDVGRAVAAAALTPPGRLCHDLVNVGTGRSIGMRELVRSLLRLSGSRATLVEGTSSGSARSAAVIDAVPDVRRAELALGWVAEDDVKTALADALAGAGLLQRAS